MASLQEKLAIEITKVEDRAENIGRTYRVYGFRSVLDRRDAAGLIWFMKDRSGVRLLRDRLIPDTLQVTRPITAKGRGRVTFQQPGAVTSKVSRPVTTEVTNIKKEEDNFVGTSTSVLAVALRQEFGYVDDEALRRIVADCRKRVPDATLNEIADLTRMTARRIGSMRNLENPVGLLIVQVPKCFEGEAFETYRKAECARKEAEERELLRLANDILQAPDMPEDSRKWATGILEEHAPQSAPTVSAEKNSENGKISVEECGQSPRHPQHRFS